MINFYKRIVNYNKYCDSIPKFKTESSKVLLCTICDDNFFPGTIVMLYSMKKHLKNFNNYKIRIFTDNCISLLSSENRMMLNKLFSNIEIIDVNNEVYRNAKVEIQEHRLAYLTMEIFNQNDYDYILFFDGDMLTIKDFSDAFNFSFPIFGSRVGKFRLKNGPSFFWKYINTGFFGISKKFLPENLYSIFMDIIINRDDKRLQLLDQKIINNYFNVNHYPYLVLNHYYNFRNFGAGDNGSEDFLKKHLSNIKIIHYSGYKVRPKPWKFDSIKEHKLEEHLAYKIWAETAKEITNEIPELKKYLLNN